MNKKVRSRDSSQDSNPTKKISKRKTVKKMDTIKEEESEENEPTQMKVAELKKELQEKHGIESQKLQKLLKAELIKMVTQQRQANIQIAQQPKPSKKRKFKDLANYQTLDQNKPPIEKVDPVENETKRIRNVIKRELPAFLKKTQEKVDEQIIQSQNPEKQEDPEIKLQKERESMIEFKRKIIAKQNELIQAKIKEMETGSQRQSIKPIIEPIKDMQPFIPEQPIIPEQEFIEEQPIIPEEEFSEHPFEEQFERNSIAERKSLGRHSIAQRSSIGMRSNAFAPLERHSFKFNEQEIPIQRKRSPDRKVWWYFALFIFILVIFLWPKQTLFCSEGQTDGCQTCPDNGICEKGQLKCFDGYIRQGHRCVENTWLIKAAKNDLKDLQNFLMQKRGAYECGEEDDFRISFNRVQNELMAKYANEVRFSYQELKSKIVEMLSSQDYPNISWDGQDELFSPTPSFTLKCYFYLTIKENLLLIIASLSTISYLWWKIKSWINSFRYRKISLQLYEEVVQELIKYGGRTSGLTQNDILRKFQAVPYKGDEYTFNQIVWPSIEAIRKSKKQVNTFQRQEFGKKVNVWVIKN